MATGFTHDERRSNVIDMTVEDHLTAATDIFCHSQADPDKTRNALLAAQLHMQFAQLKFDMTRTSTSG